MDRLGKFLYGRKYRVMLKMKDECLYCCKAGIDRVLYSDMCIRIMWKISESIEDLWV